MKLRRVASFLVVFALTASSLVAVAQQPGKKPAASPAKPAPAKVVARKPADAGAEATELVQPLAAKEERTHAVAATKDAGGGAVLEAKTLDGGAKVFRFGEVEVEGRLKSPQIVYFLRRVRAEFAAGDLGHRTFVRELGETRNEPGF